MNNNRIKLIIRTCIIIMTVMLFAGTVHAAQGKWKTVDGKKIYVLANGKKASGLTKVGKNLYYFRKGVWKKGWKSVDGRTYYFSPKNGKAYSGVKKIGKKIYVFKTNKALAGTGLYKIGEKTWYAKQGILKTGFVKYKGNTYYSTTDGLLKGLQKITNKYGKVRCYYFSKKTYAMVTNKTIGGRYFGPKGYQIKLEQEEPISQPTVTKISAVCSKSSFDKGYTFIKSDFTVTATMSDGTTKKVTDYTLSQKETTSVVSVSGGAKETGKCTITITYSGKTTTVSVSMNDIFLCIAPGI